jgi:hypothetical protein
MPRHIRRAPEHLKTERSQSPCSNLAADRSADAAQTRASVIDGRSNLGQDEHDARRMSLDSTSRVHLS